MALSPIIEGTVNIQERHAQIYKDNVCVSTEALKIWWKITKKGINKSYKS